ncbi:MAG: hypothetical protein K2N14_02910 [Clostridia bacterium]|nr:hypothetical protein [Clostridia bacterium]
MKKRNVISVIIILAAIVCMTCGLLFRMQWLIYLTLGLLVGGAIIASLVILIMGIVRASKDRRAENNGEDIDPHAQFIDNEENKRGVERMLGEVSYEGNQWLNAFKTQTVGTVVFGLIFIALLVLGPMAGTYYFELWWHQGGLGFCAGGAAVILFGLIVSTVYRNVTMRLAENDMDATEATGVAVASSMISRHQIGYGGDMYGSRKILRITYKVKLKIDGRTVIGYSRNRYYKRGEEVKVKYNPKHPHRCYIIN